MYVLYKYVCTVDFIRPFGQRANFFIDRISLRTAIPPLIV